MAELSTLARPYAKAAFEFAVDAKDLQGWAPVSYTHLTLPTTPYV